MTAAVTGERGTTPQGRRSGSAGLAAASYVVLLAAAAAACGSYFDESASRCGSLLAAGSGPECGRHRTDRVWITVISGGIGLALMVVALIPRGQRHARSVRPAWSTPVIGLLAPGLEVALIVLLRHLWGPVGEEYTGMPDVWAPVALVAGVLAACLMAKATGLALSWCIAGAAAATPIVTLIQALSAELGISSHGVTEPAHLPLVYPVGQEHPLALALSGVAVAALLAIARIAQGHGAIPVTRVSLSVFAGTSALVVALLVIDASPDAFSFAPLGHWVWAPLLGASALTATVTLVGTTRRQPIP